MNSNEVFIHIHQGCFAGTGAIVRLPQCQWSKPDEYGKISQCITTTKQSKAKTVCTFLGIYCMCGNYLILVKRALYVLLFNDLKFRNIARIAKYQQYKTHRFTYSMCAVQIAALYFYQRQYSYRITQMTITITSTVHCMILIYNLPRICPDTMLQCHFCHAFDACHCRDIWWYIYNDQGNKITIDIPLVLRIMSSLNFTRCITLTS